MESDYQNRTFTERVKASYEEYRKEFDESPVLAELLEILEPEKKEKLLKVIRDSHEHMIDVGLLLYTNGFEEGKELRSISDSAAERGES